MRPTFLGFETAKRGLMVSQKSLDIVGQNLTNVSTPGYTRQRVDQVSVSASTFRTRYGSNKTMLAGQGVDISGISQIRNAFLDKRFRDEYGDVGYYDQATSILSDVESALDEYDTDAGLLNAISEISSALNDFSSDADSKTQANIVAISFQNIVQVLKQFSTKLDNVAEQQKYNLELAVSDVNSMLEQVAALNKTISEDMSTYSSGSGYSEPNELLDERNLLLDELSRYADLDVAQNTDGTVTVKMNGHVVVEGGKAETINCTRNSDSTVSLNWQSDGKAVQLTTGSLKASVEIINGRGLNAGSSNEGIEKGILYYKDKINTFAQMLVQTVNQVVPQTDADGNILKDANGNTVYKTLLGAKVQATDASGNPIEGEYVTTTNVPVTAANISLSDQWMADSSYFLFGDDNLDSTYAIAMIKALTGDTITFQAGGESFTGTFEEYVQDYNGTLATDVSFYSGRLDAVSAIADSLLDSRDAISGVMPDEETTNMMLYQKAYQAIARVMTAMDEALDVLINGTGRVGL